MSTPQKPQQTTIVFPRKGDEVLLGMKKRGFGAGWWNGFGGKLDAGESFEDSATRETLEECKLEVSELQPVAQLLFYFDEQLKIVSQVFTTTSFSGTPTETDEMKPQWYKTDELPFDNMWADDPEWLPQALELKPSDEPLRLAVFLDSDNNFLRIENRTANQVAKYFKV